MSNGHNFPFSVILYYCYSNYCIMNASRIFSPLINNNQKHTIKVRHDFNENSKSFFGKSFRHYETFHGEWFALWCPYPLESDNSATWRYQGRCPSFTKKWSKNPPCSWKLERGWFLRLLEKLSRIVPRLPKLFMKHNFWRFRGGKEKTYHKPLLQSLKSPAVQIWASITQIGNVLRVRHTFLFLHQ